MVRPATSAGLLDFVTPPPNFEVIRYSYYSRQAAFTASAAPTNVSFFANQVGVSSATLRDTNMTKPNAIANPKRFLAQWLQFRLYSTLVADVTTATEVASLIGDMNTVLTRGVLVIKLLDKEYLTIPAMDVPAGSGLYSALTMFTSTGAANPTNGVPDRRNAYPIELPLEREANFTVELQFPDASIPALTDSGTLRPEVVLTGLLLRPKQ